MTIIRWKTIPVLLLLLAAARPARGGDETKWVLLHGGDRLAARGALEVREPFLRFHTPEGVLVALRLELVDLEATRAAAGLATPHDMRTLVLPEPPLVAPAPLGATGERARASGRHGTFTDLADSELMEPPPPLPKPTTARGARRPAGRRVTTPKKSKRAAADPD